MKPTIPPPCNGYKLWMWEGKAQELWQWKTATEEDLFDVASNKGTVAEGLSRLAASSLAGLLFQDRGVDAVRLKLSRLPGEWVLLETITGEPR